MPRSRFAAAVAGVDGLLIRGQAPGSGGRVTLRAALARLLMKGAVINAGLVATFGQDLLLQIGDSLARADDVGPKF